MYDKRKKDENTLSRKIKYYYEQLSNIGLVVVVPIIIYYGIKIVEGPNPSGFFYFDVIFFYILLVFSVWTYLMYQCEKIAEFIDKKIGKLRFIGSILRVVIVLSLTFASYFFCIYDYDQNSFSNVNGKNLFETYINFIFYSVGVFLMNGNSPIEAISLYAKLFTTTEMMTTFVAIVLILANYKELKNPFNEHSENKGKHD